MSSRTHALLIASVLLGVLTAQVMQAQVPYIALGPGPTYDTLGKSDGRPLLEIEGRRTFPTEGQLDLTTVRVYPGQGTLTMAQALGAWFARDRAVVPAEQVFPPGRSDDEVDRANAEAMATSQSSAVSAAARQLGLRTAHVVVREVPAGAPAAGLLRVGDVLRTVDGRRLRDAADLRAAVARTPVGQVVRIGFERAGRPGSVDIRTRQSQDDGAVRPVIGVVTSEKPVDAPFDVTVTLKEVGGPSAGLMFALGILDKLDEPALTGGRHIAGTGAITSYGEVRPIGGIAQKLLAAAQEGADAFLVPQGNCADAVRNAPDGLPLVEVGSLDQALTALADLRRGEQPELCPTG